MFGPVPTKLVQRIQVLQYIDMKELLPDNIGLLRHMEALVSPKVIAPLAIRSRLRLREVNSLLLWALCYISYVAILSELHQGLGQIPPGLFRFGHIRGQAQWGRWLPIV